MYLGGEKRRQLHERKEIFSQNFLPQVHYRDGFETVLEILNIIE